MKFLRVSQVSELTGLHPSGLRRMLMEHATIQKNKSFIKGVTLKELHSDDIGEES
ncbi:hypothetical protein BCJMU51_3255 [Bacillus cereus]|nr:hypothetical protein BCM0045_3226 [Bacillus cereus]BCC01172.1 hypothetical protein BCM0057_3254 [Bacillus cereus]BCC24678.1 hypothetical protein BCM0079_3271 [Bacillus cereus]BCC36258.1 hypothetical protein BCM0105_3248 [Bacillus cereus]BCC42059.1 hypothetical protein BCJMU01_3226 [Bacillus cereus]